MISSSYTTCPWFKVLFSAYTYTDTSSIVYGTPYSMTKKFPGIEYFSKTTGPLLIGKDLQGFVRRVRISNGFASITEHKIFLANDYLPSTPPLCTDYVTYGDSCLTCDRACSHCIGPADTQCTDSCTLAVPVTDATSLYPFGSCPEFTCDGRCGPSQTDCLVPRNNTQCDSTCGTGANLTAVNTCECEWNYDFSIINNVCELNPNPCHASCKPNACDGRTAYNCTECRTNYY